MADIILSDANSHGIYRASNYTSFGPQICYPLKHVYTDVAGSNDEDEENENDVTGNDAAEGDEDDDEEDEDDDDDDDDDDDEDDPGMIP